MAHRLVGPLRRGGHALSKSRIPDQRLDASGECLHLYLARDGVCVHCGMRFELAWSTERGALLLPTRKNLAYAEVVTKFADDIAEPMRLVLADAQTSGGLLLILPAAKANDALMRVFPVEPFR